MALLNPITAPWECGLALPSGLCGAPAAIWGPVSFCPHWQSPEGQASSQCPETPSILRNAWRPRGKGVHAVSKEVLHLCAQGSLLHMQPTFTCGHIPACQCTASHAAGIHDPTCVCLSFSHQGQPSHGHMPHLWLLLGTMCRPLHSYVSATCMCRHALFTGVCVCTLHFASEQVVFRNVSCIPMWWDVSVDMGTPYVCL